MNEPKLPQNFGGALLSIDGQDFIAGSTSPIILEPRNTTKNWLQFFGTPETQLFSWGDPLGCVSFSAVHHCIVPQLNWALKNNLIHYPALQFFQNNGYIIDGKFNLSERFIVVKSETTPQGNTWQNVAQAIRKYGVVPELICPNSSPKSREEYFTVSNEAESIGLQSLKYLDFPWQIVPLGLVNSYLIQSPIVGFIPICQDYNTANPVKTCSQPVQHAIGIYAPSNPIWPIYDSYIPFQKYLDSTYQIPYTFQQVVNFKPQGTDPGTPAPKPHVFTVDMKYGDRGQEMLFLQERLAVPQTGIYDEETRAAVFHYQLEHLLPTFQEMVFSLFGRRVGPLTRSVLNKTL